nr:MAG TPA: hypothetical protein [Bacteriophage sp.]
MRKIETHTSVGDRQIYPRVRKIKRRVSWSNG